jgi:hypothetical protein
MVDYCRSNGYLTMALDSVDINASMQAICDYGTREGYDTMLVTASDLPFFSSKLVDSMLGHLRELLACNDSGAVFSPSRGLGMTVCCASPPGSVHLFIDDRTPNFLLLDRVAGSTPRRLAFGIEGFLDIDRVEHLYETHQLMCEMPDYRNRKVFAFLEGWLAETANESVPATEITERAAPVVPQGAVTL